MHPIRTWDTSPSCSREQAPSSLLSTLHFHYVSYSTFLTASSGVVSLTACRCKFISMNRRAGATDRHALLAGGAYPTSSSLPSSYRSSSPYDSSPYASSSSQPYNPSDYIGAPKKEPSNASDSIFGRAASNYSATRTAEDLEEQNDSRLDGLTARVSMLKEITLNIGTEVREGTKELGTLGEAFESTSAFLGGTFKRMNKMAKRQGSWFCNMMLFLLFVTWLFVSRIRASVGRGREFTDIRKLLLFTISFRSFSGGGEGDGPHLFYRIPTILTSLYLYHARINMHVAASTKTNRTNANCEPSPTNKGIRAEPVREHPAFPPLVSLKNANEAKTKRNNPTWESTLEESRTIESQIERVGDFGPVHLQTMNSSFAQRSARAQLLECTLGQIHMVWTASSTLVDHPYHHTVIVSLLVAELDKLTTLRSCFPIFYHGANVARVDRLPVATPIATLRVEQVVRCIPCDLHILRPE